MLRILYPTRAPKSKKTICKLSFLRTPVGSKAVYTVPFTPDQHHAANFRKQSHVPFVSEYVGCRVLKGTQRVHVPKLKVFTPHQNYDSIY